MSHTPIDNLLRAADFTEAVTPEMVLEALAQAWGEGYSSYGDTGNPYTPVRYP